jgi:hypothetical protein
MLVIMVVDFIMLSPVQAIMAAEAGDNAKAENIAAEINSFILASLEISRRNAGQRDTYVLRGSFREEDIFLCCGAANVPPASPTGAMEHGLDADEGPAAAPAMPTTR